MAKVPYGVETLPKISIAWVGRMNVTDDRQTDDRWTTTYSVSSRSLKFHVPSEAIWITIENSASKLVLKTRSFKPLTGSLKYVFQGFLMLQHCIQATQTLILNITLMLSLTQTITWILTLNIPNTNTYSNLIPGFVISPCHCMSELVLYNTTFNSTYNTRRGQSRIRAFRSNIYRPPIS